MPERSTATNERPWKLEDVKVGIAAMHALLLKQQAEIDAIADEGLRRISQIMKDGGSVYAGAGIHPALEPYGVKLCRSLMPDDLVAISNMTPEEEEKA